MATLTGLPNELILEIASFISGPRGFRHQSLKSLALVCRSLRFIAQDELYSRVEIPIPTDFTAHGSSKIGLLARTLCECPNLAERVKKLDVWVLDRDSGHQTRACRVNIAKMDDEECICGWSAAARVCRDYMGAQDGSAENELYTYSWDYKIRCGHEPALCGLILSVCSDLKDLTLNYLTQFDLDSRRDLGRDDWLASSLHQSAFFPHYGKHQNDVFALINGLSSLERFTTNCLAPWEVVSLPRLHDLQVDVTGSGPHRFSLVSHDPPLGTFRPSITKLIITTPLDTLGGACPKYVHLYLQALVSSLQSLRHLFLQISNRNSWYEEDQISGLLMNWPSYNNILYMIADEHSHLETLGVDISGIGPLTGQGMAQLSRFKSLTELSKLPGLRRIIGPQELFLEVKDGVGHIIEMPRCIESIHIVDPTPAFRYMLKHIVDRQSTDFAYLKEISLWRYGLEVIPFDEEWGVEKDIERLRRAGIRVIMDKELKGPWKEAILP
ncbi:hypothetical protein K491DRAFT_719476 [Lophiostoma macrostomum CBS 122681]|uniref:F-box domain-containing protein n=1 Tax=Lophiostoma macrostomum CBS 122681 TaxID=1314788 RepID=A0A6A6SVS8_9PLEO|nr:hypothetical protein K491DRAFT_719476 [Lophiostoma macrostomum CBS 122681]